MSRGSVSCLPCGWVELGKALRPLHSPLSLLLFFLSLPLFSASFLSRVHVPTLLSSLFLFLSRFFPLTSSNFFYFFLKLRLSKVL